MPESLDTGRKLKALEKAFADHLYTTRKLSLWENRTLGLVSQPGESEAASASAVEPAARQGAEQALAMEKVKFKPKFEALDMKLPDEKPAAKAGGSWLGWIFPAPQATESDDPKLEEKRRKLTTDYQSKVAEIAEKWKRVGEEATAIQVKPRKADVHVTHFGLGWAPLGGRRQRTGKASGGVYPRRANAGINPAARRQINSAIGSPYGRIGIGRPRWSRNVVFRSRCRGGGTSSPTGRSASAAGPWGARPCALVEPTTWPISHAAAATPAPTWRCGQWSRPGCFTRSACPRRS